MTRYDEVQQELRDAPLTWLVTGAAGFIGSHLVEELLELDQRVVGLDNFSTGKIENLRDVQSKISPERWARFRHIDGDIRDLNVCRDACGDVDRVLHQAALGSVPRSLEDPLRSHANNVNGFLNMLVAVRDAGKIRLVYASSSSIYGDHEALPKIEANIGAPLSPYAGTKAVNEIYAGIFSRCYDLSLVGLRYFNVFGPRQDPNGAYAAVIPRWFDALFRGEVVHINGDGATSRDFCFIKNVVQANILAAMSQSGNREHRVYNIACGQRTTLLELYNQIRVLVAECRPGAALPSPSFGPERRGDVKHSLADISRAQASLAFRPTHAISDGLRETCAWYESRASGLKAQDADRASGRL